MTTFLFLLVVIFAIVAYVISQQPDEFRITRTRTLNAAPENIFQQVNNLRLWNAWSPWARLDPNAVTTFEGPEAGVGAVMRWSGNKNVGQGSMTVVESSVPSLVKFKMEFLKPMKATNSAEFTFTAQGGQTEVSWSIYGHNNFMRKIFDSLLNCDKMVGVQFEKGLTNLQGLVEKK